MNANNVPALRAREATRSHARDVWVLTFRLFLEDGSVIIVDPSSHLVLDDGDDVLAQDALGKTLHKAYSTYDGRAVMVVKTETRIGVR